MKDGFFLGRFFATFSKVCKRGLTEREKGSWSRLGWFGNGRWADFESFRFFVLLFRFLDCLRESSGSIEGNSGAAFSNLYFRRRKWEGGGRFGAYLRNIWYFGVSKNIFDFRMRHVDVFLFFLFLLMFFIKFCFLSVGRLAWNGPTFPFQWTNGMLRDRRIGG